MNRCTFFGRLTRDPELKAVGANSKKVSVGLAVDRFYKRKDGKGGKETTFINLEAWDSAAELIADKLRKGDPILVDDASVKVDTWDDKESGNKRSKTYFRINEFSFVGGRAAPEPDKEPAAEPVGVGADDGQDIPF